MSLAQRRTAPEGINTIFEDDTWENGRLEAAGDERYRRDSTDTQTTVTLPGTEGKDLWQTISYDAFAPPPPQHYEPVLLEDTDHLAAYEVSTAKRVGECFRFFY